MTNWIHQIGCDLADTDEMVFSCTHEMAKAKGKFEDMLYCWKCENGCQCCFIIKAYKRGRLEIIERVRDLHARMSCECVDCTIVGDLHDPVCKACGDDYAYPCPTIRALDGEQE